MRVVDILVLLDNGKFLCLFIRNWLTVTSCGWAANELLKSKVHLCTFLRNFPSSRLLTYNPALFPCERYYRGFKYGKIYRAVCPYDFKKRTNTVVFFPSPHPNRCNYRHRSVFQWIQWLRIRARLLHNSQETGPCSAFEKAGNGGAFWFELHHETTCGEKS